LNPKINLVWGLTIGGCLKISQFGAKDITALQSGVAAKVKELQK
jgi:hypothetical protein